MKILFLESCLGMPIYGVADQLALSCSGRQLTQQKLGGEERGGGERRREEGGGGGGGGGEYP